MKIYQTLTEIISQLSMCKYECEGGFLANNVAFIRLKEIAESNYQPKFYLNEKVIYAGSEYYVRGIRTVSSSHPKTEVEYSLSLEWQRQCTSNKSDIEWINENSIFSIHEWDIILINNAKKLLIDKGIIQENQLNRTEADNV